MAKAATRKGSNKVRRQGRRVLPALRRTAGRAQQAVARVAQLTLGEVIAAAFDTAGGEREAALKLMASEAMARRLGRRILPVP